jgi:hypothetical protein
MARIESVVCPIRDRLIMPNSDALPNRSHNVTIPPDTMFIGASAPKEQHG